MSDSRIRRTARLAETSGAPESDAAVLRDRLRVGAVTEEQLRIAAYADHLPASLALSGVEVTRFSTLAHWIGGLELAGLVSGRPSPPAYTGVSFEELGVTDPRHVDQATLAEITENTFRLARHAQYQVFAGTVEWLDQHQPIATGLRSVLEEVLRIFATSNDTGRALDCLRNAIQVDDFACMAMLCVKTAHVSEDGPLLAFLKERLSSWALAQSAPRLE